MKFSVFSIVTTLLASTALALPVVNSASVQLVTRGLDENWPLLEKRTPGNSVVLPSGQSAANINMANANNAAKVTMMSRVRTGLNNIGTGLKNFGTNAKNFVMGKPVAGKIAPEGVTMSPPVKSSEGGSNWNPANWKTNFNKWNANRKANNELKLIEKNKVANAKLLNQKAATKAKVDKDIQATKDKLAALELKSQGKADKLAALEAKVQGEPGKFQGKTFGQKVQKKVDRVGEFATEKVNAAGKQLQNQVDNVKAKAQAAKDNLFPKKLTAEEKMNQQFEKAGVPMVESVNMGPKDSKLSEPAKKIVESNDNLFSFKKSESQVKDVNA